MVICSICGKQYTFSSLVQHEKKCVDTWEREQVSSSSCEWAVVVYMRDVIMRDYDSWRGSIRHKTSGV